MRTASVLESHPGVNGGLDVAGRFKKRSSDEDLRASAQVEEVQEQLVYIHHVQPSDTYAGIVLKYQCRADAFRKANGLWNPNNIQVRKWLALPVDACEIRGRPCDGPSITAEDVDLLAPTPQPSRQSDSGIDDFFAASNGQAARAQKAPDEEDRPWAHVRWVRIENFSAPVEIARVSRKALGFFPPRRKKSIRTASTLSTPRGSIDVPSVVLSDSQLESPESASSRRYNTMAGRGQVATAYGGTSSPATSRSRVGSGGDDLRPVWMRRPGGVGSLSRSVRMPGPQRDYLNKWAQKHLPGISIDNLPSMSVMGSETAHLGFDPDAVAIVESPFAEGHDATSSRTGGGGSSGLEHAAAAVETWLRGAFARRPSTPLLGPRGGRATQDEGLGDLIELEDTNSDDGRGGLLAQPASGGSGLPSSFQPFRTTTGWSEGEGAVKSRAPTGGGSLHKGKKAD
jgi:LysM repeat protein